MRALETAAGQSALHRLAPSRLAASHLYTTRDHGALWLWWRSVLWLVFSISLSGYKAGDHPVAKVRR